ncbi:sugar ABC transporter ATP-binding protein [Parasphaerochaeta coccoides]|uniref:Monosaccharide ABC transporter ATP-binding protein, CUT2 family n=1 Tax=Parasphaerochaeta coccoides (strain ATCC BAA-1237 / DSM 17374 / SPN1) TaxID=760011 RepID=F4GKG1_PARC1|nr:sugar ABC transporter ATP-binding protein [Parasphaerochaeta coccoides]AEC02844.1 monosaccharide ABC transporter ATP-binding protein, CUT2 family [Parasphaerochaeta coccoides DSM 17374]
MGEIVLSMKKIDKRFSGVHALKGVDFELRAGEIHALVGENGAGKSTLMKALTGIFPKDSGEIWYMGHLFNPASPRQALDAGIAIVHQELNMMEDLTVAQNIFIGRESMRNSWFLDEKAQNERAEKLLSQLNMDIDPAARLADLTVGKQQMVEIAKAVSYNLRILILDEPTASLTEKEIEDLFAIMRSLSDRGVGMIYISHRLDEIGMISHRVTVLRDGECIGTRDTAALTKKEMIDMMVGRVIYEEPKTHSTVAHDAPVVLDVSGLKAGRMVDDVSFTLRKGEILGFSGLMGAGRTETMRALYGADPAEGVIKINGRKVHISSPIDAVRVGIGYLSEDRKRYGLALGLSVSHNTLMASYEMLNPRFLLDMKRLEGMTGEYVQRLQVKTPTLDQLAKNLSGGNQQKVVIAKWLLKNSSILIFDEPTRGIDVGAKSEIYALMNELAGQGKAIIMVSSELPEILRMSDRVAVMCEGRITGILDIAEATQEKIMELATRGWGT